MPWWGWLVFGAALLGAEIVVSTDFWLATVGAAALVIGLVLPIPLIDPDPRAWVQWSCFAALAVLITGLFRRRLYERLVGRPPGLEPELVGESGVAIAPIAPGAEGSVEVRGTTWQARNVGTEPLAARAPVRVTAVRGILLEVRG
jgi:membrane protein implicated in regulation of membrane protease activity